jgi:hypothetical protein
MSVLIDAERVRALTPWPKLIDALQSVFHEPCEAPERLHFDIGLDGVLALEELAAAALAWNASIASKTSLFC